MFRMFRNWRICKDISYQNTLRILSNQNVKPEVKKGKYLIFKQEWCAFITHTISLKFKEYGLFFLIQAKYFVWVNSPRLSVKTFSSYFFKYLNFQLIFPPFYQNFLVWNFFAFSLSIEGRGGSLRTWFLFHGSPQSRGEENATIKQRRE